MVIEPPFLSTPTAAKIKTLRGRGFATKRLFHDDTYTSWVKNRPDTVGASWDAALAPETWMQVAAGTGRLYANGQGGPVVSEDVIVGQAPYRFRTLAEEPFVANVTHLLINDRFFKVDHFEAEDADDALANAYLTEIDRPAGVPS